jgi:hypothetical protein
MRSEQFGVTMTGAMARGATGVAFRPVSRGARCFSEDGAVAVAMADHRFFGAT